MTEEKSPLEETPESPAEDAATETEAAAEAQAAGEERDWPGEARRFQDLYLRCAAEMENMRRRFQREREEQARFASERLIKGLVPALDNLYLALGYAREDWPAEALSLAEGIRLTLKGFLDALADHGVRRTPAERGQAFDPNLHEAIGQKPETDIPAGTISEEVQPGYTLYERLVRPAKVIVASVASSD